MKHKWHEGRKYLNSTKMDQWGKTPERHKKSRRWHGCVCCVCCIRTSMERKVTRRRTEGFKQYKMDQREKTGQEKKSHRRHGCLSLVSVVCCQVQVSATSWSLVQRSPTDCGVSKRSV
jgi:hypothetical protein